jgi:hypothetical protein
MLSRYINKQSVHIALISFVNSLHGQGETLFEWIPRTTGLGRDLLKAVENF